MLLSKASSAYISDADSSLAHLGISSGHISVDQFNYIGSSTYYTWVQCQAKLFSQSYSGILNLNAAWLADAFAGQWFQVDLYILHKIQGLITQGAGHTTHTIKSISIGLSNDTLDWQMIKAQGTNNNEVMNLIT